MPIPRPGDRSPYVQALQDWESPAAKALKGAVPLGSSGVADVRGAIVRRVLVTMITMTFADDPAQASGCGLFFPQVIGGDASVAVVGGFFGQTAPDDEPAATFDAGFGIPGEPATGVCTGGTVNPDPPDNGGGGPNEDPGELAPIETTPTLPTTGLDGGGLSGPTLLGGLALITVGLAMSLTLRGAGARRPAAPRR